MWIKKCVVLLFACITMNYAAAETVFHDTWGNQVTDTQLNNKWVIVNYWASWCDSCVEEISELNKFFKDNNDKSVVFYGVNYDHLSADELNTTVKNVNINYPVLIEDPTSLWHFAAMEVIPTTFIVNPKGKVVKTIVGPTSAKMLASTLKSLQK